MPSQRQNVDKYFNGVGKVDDHRMFNIFSSHLKSPIYCLKTKKIMIQMRVN